jgi:hypothetical protein
MSCASFSLTNCEPIGAGASSRSPAENAARDHYRDLMQRMKDTKGLKDLAGSNLYKGQEKIKELENALWGQESKKTAACIRNRNDVSTADLRQDYEAAVKQIGKKSSDKPLQVFCVSALVFFDFLRGNTTTEPGFSRAVDTGIPVLQKWLVEITLATRDRNALAFLEDLVSLELSMRPWIEDTKAEYKMQDRQKGALEDHFDKKFAELNKVRLIV